MCVEWCLNDVLTYEEREEEVEEQVEMEEVELGLGSLMDKYGVEKDQWTPLPGCRRRIKTFSRIEKDKIDGDYSPFQRGNRRGKRKRWRRRQVMLPMRKVRHRLSLEQGEKFQYAQADP